MQILEIFKKILSRLNMSHYFLLIEIFEPNIFLETY